MKTVFTFLFLSFALATSAQQLDAGISLDIKKRVHGKVCDSCPVKNYYESAEDIPWTKSFVIISDGEIEKNTPAPAGSKLYYPPYYFDYQLVANEVTINFLSKPTRYYFPELVVDSANHQFRMQEHKDDICQFAVYQNGRQLQDWKDMRTLEIDSGFQTGYYLQTTQRTSKYFSLNSYRVGQYTLNISDSLVVMIRLENTNDIIQSILIKRIPAPLTHFDFLKFSADEQLQDVLNHGGTNTFNNDTVRQQLQMHPNEIGLLRFVDSGKIKKVIEYSFDEGSVNWQKLVPDPHSNYSYILINKPQAGKNIQLSLRYTLQPETIHRVDITVQSRFFNSVWFKLLSTIAVMILLFGTWWWIKKRKHTRQLRNLQFVKEETESKLQLLSGQLNPHFLFNSLNAVQNLVNQKETEKANLHISEVSVFLRTIMEAGRKEYISLQEELNMEIDYMQLEQRRRHFEYQINNECNTGADQIEFPPLLLQPVIENSIHHGFYVSQQTPRICIAITCNDEQVRVTVQDNGGGFDTTSFNQGQGLTLVRKRITLINQKLQYTAIEMKIESGPNGTTTTFTFQNWI